MYFLYNVLLTLALVCTAPALLLCIFITGHYRDGLRQRLGLVPYQGESDSSGKPKLWIHACSVGEVAVIHPIISEIRDIYPSSRIIVSNSTKTGHEYAKDTLEGVRSYLYFPIDVWWVVKRVLRTTAPDVFVVSETEIWPNFLRMAKKLGAMTIMVTGRISKGSFGRYMKVKPFMKTVLQNLDIMSMITQADADRIVAMGASPERVFTNGNSKYDRLVEKVRPEFQEEVRRTLSISEKEKVFIAGSTRKGEEEILIESYLKFVKVHADMVMILAPRHVERIGEVKKLLHLNKLDFVLKTDINKGKARRNEQVILVDTIGDLFKVYSTGTLIFCGGSLVPLGGHNVMEAAAWGKAVFYGPSMENFQDAKELLESVGAGVEITGADDLVEKGLQLLEEPERLESLGAAGRKAAMGNRGSARKNAKLIEELIEK